MEKTRVFIFLSICLFFVFLFHNCAPLTEQGGFKETQVSVFSVGNPNNKNTEETKDKESENKEEKEGEEKDDEEKEDEEKEGEEKDDEEKEGEEDNKPSTNDPGEEFFDSETEEKGPNPITRRLY